MQTFAARGGGRLIPCAYCGGWLSSKSKRFEYRRPGEALPETFFACNAAHADLYIAQRREQDRVRDEGMA